MSLFVWAVVGAGLGLVAYIGGGPIVAPALPARLRRRLGQMYFKHAAAATRRPFFVNHDAGWAFAAASFDGERRTERVAPFGDTKDYEDPANLKRWFYKRPAGVVNTTINGVITPLYARLVELRHRMVRDGDDQIRIEIPGDGEETRTATYPDATVPVEQGIHLAVPREWDRGAAHQTSPERGDTAEQFIYNSQVEFNSRDAVKYMVLLFAYLAGVGGIVAVSQYGRPSRIDIPLLVDVLVGVL